MTTLLLDLWAQTWRDLGCLPPTTLCNALLQAYDAPDRHYHTRQHLQECLEGLAACPLAPAERPAAALALWFHDAVYVPGAHDNEARSAAWAHAALSATGLPPALVDTVGQLILATATHTACHDTLTQVVSDVDLSILAAPPERFAEYEAQIRAEYASVPSASFAVGRRHILQNFLARPRLFQSDVFFQRCEQAARHNLEHALATGYRSCRTT